MNIRLDPVWRGDTVAVIATGQSLTQDQVDRAKGLRVIVVNDAFRLAPWADMLYAADARWWQHNPDALAFTGKKLCAQPHRPEGVFYIQSSGVGGFDPDPARIRTGGNSGYQAIHVAIHQGATKIILLGFDMHGTHYFGPHKAPLRNTHEVSFRLWRERFSALNNRGAEIINCTPGSKLRAFPVMTLDQALA